VRYTTQQVKDCLKKSPQSFLIFPIAIPINYLIANFTPIEPESVAIASMVVGAAGAVLALFGQWLGAGLLYYLFFVLDACDGGLARLRRHVSREGAVLDLRCDRFVLVLSVLTHAHYFLRHSMAVEVEWTVLFAMLFYYLDVFNLYRAGDVPLKPADPQTPRRASTAASAGKRPLQAFLKGLGRVEERILPWPYFCLMLFFCGGAFFPVWRNFFYAAACAGVVWNLFRGFLRANVYEWAWQRPSQR